MKNPLRALTCLALTALCFCLAPLPDIRAEDASQEWTYDNTVVVTVQTPQTRRFDPADFPEVEAEAVYISAKAPVSGGYRYDLVLLFSKDAPVSIDEAIQALQSNPLVTSATRNQLAAKSEIRLNQDSLLLRVGESADLFIEHLKFNTDPPTVTGVTFSVDPEAIDTAGFDKDFFSGYGIERFWPDTAFDGTPSLSTPPDSALEGTVSPNGVYYGLVAGRTNEMEKDLAVHTLAVDRLAQAPGVLSAALVTEAFPTGDPFRETWSSQNPSIVNFTLAGGDPPDITSAVMTPLNQTATVEGMAPGTATITVQRSGFGGYASDSCHIMVYRPGDVNLDNTVTASDALLALQAATQKIQLEPLPAYAALSGESRPVTSADALTILQMATGKLDITG